MPSPADLGAREWLRARAAGACMDVGHVFSHDSAAHAWQLPFLTSAVPKIHVTRPVNGSRHASGVHHHLAPYAPEQVVEVDGLPVLDRARTAVDLARYHGLRVGIGACDSALRAGVARAELWQAVAPMKRWRGVVGARQAIELADAGAENPAESLTRLAVCQATSLKPITQFPVVIGSGTAWLDVLAGPHGIEFDGRIKYRRCGDGGVAQEDPGEVVWRERMRERDLLAAGIGISRVIWNDLLPHHWTATCRRLEAEIEASVRRFGWNTPDALLQTARALDPERQRRIHARA